MQIETSLHPPIYLYLHLILSYLNRKKTKKKIQSADKRLPASVLESNLKVQVDHLHPLSTLTLPFPRNLPPLL